MRTRRYLLKSGALTLAGLGLVPGFASRLAASLPNGTTPDGTLLDRALPSTARRPPILVTIFLRGAMDGLMAVPPLEDPFLKQYRPNLAMGTTGPSREAIQDLDGRFGLHPALAPLLPYWSEGRLAIVHGVGSPNPTRSHFEAQDVLEAGTPWRRGTPSGWLNRALSGLGNQAPFRAVSLTPDLPRSLSGPESALAIRDLTEFELRLPFEPDDARLLGESLQNLYAESGKRFAQAGRQTFESLRILSTRDLIAYREERSSRYPQSELGRSLLQIAFMIKAGVGLQIAFAESTGWDTHAHQGRESGTFAYWADDLARAVQAFWEDIELFQDQVVVLTLTEFGRTVRENGSRGTDHGHGSCLFALGNRVDGGKVYGNLPELSPGALFEGRDLPITTDYRAVLAEVAGKLFDIRDDQLLFPGWEGLRLPLLW